MHVCTYVHKWQTNGKTISVRIAKRMTWVPELPGSAEFLFAAWREAAGRKAEPLTFIPQPLVESTAQTSAEVWFHCIDLQTLHLDTNLTSPVRSKGQHLLHLIWFNPKPWVLDEALTSLGVSSEQPARCHHCPSLTCAAKFLLLHIASPAETVISTNSKFCPLEPVSPGMNHLWQAANTKRHKNLLFQKCSTQVPALPEASWCYCLTSSVMKKMNHSFQCTESTFSQQWHAQQWNNLSQI